MRIRHALWQADIEADALGVGLQIRQAEIRGAGAGAHLRIIEKIQRPRRRRDHPRQRARRVVQLVQIESAAFRDHAVKRRAALHRIEQQLESGGERALLFQQPRQFLALAVTAAQQLAHADEVALPQQIRRTCHMQTQIANEGARRFLPMRFAGALRLDEGIGDAPGDDHGFRLIRTEKVQRVEASAIAREFLTRHGDLAVRVENMHGLTHASGIGGTLPTAARRDHRILALGVDDQHRAGPGQQVRDKIRHALATAIAADNQHMPIIAESHRLTIGTVAEIKISRLVAIRWLQLMPPRGA